MRPPPSFSSYLPRLPNKHWKPANTDTSFAHVCCPIKGINHPSSSSLCHQDRKRPNKHDVKQGINCTTPLISLLSVSSELGPGTAVYHSISCQTQIRIILNYLHHHRHHRHRCRRQDAARQGHRKNCEGLDERSTFQTSKVKRHIIPRTQWFKSN